MSAAEPIAAGDYDFPALRPVPFAAFRDEVLALYRPPLRAPATFDKMRHALDQLAALIGDGSTADLTPPLIARFVASQPEANSPNSTRSKLQSVRAACSYAKARGYLLRSPFEARRSWVRPARPRDAKHHAREEIARVLDLLRRDVDARAGWPRWRARRLYALAALVAFTGMRRNEALHMHAADVDLAGRMLAIVSRRGRLKTPDAAQPVPMPEPLAGILADWLAHRLATPTAEDVPEGAAARPRPTEAGCPWLFPNLHATGPWTGGPTGHKPLDALKAAGERAGVEGFTFLSLRHSFATHAEFWGLSPAMIQRILRHTTTRTQWHYRHADAQNLRDVARRIDFGAGPEAAAAGGPADADRDA